MPISIFSCIKLPHFQFVSKCLAQYSVFFSLYIEFKKKTLLLRYQFTIRHENNVTFCNIIQSMFIESRLISNGISKLYSMCFNHFPFHITCKSTFWKSEKKREL